MGGFFGGGAPKVDYAAQYAAQKAAADAAALETLEQQRDDKAAAAATAKDQQAAEKRRAQTGSGTLLTGGAGLSGTANVQQSGLKNLLGQ